MNKRAESLETRVRGEQEIQYSIIQLHAIKNISLTVCFGVATISIWPADAGIVFILQRAITLQCACIFPQLHLKRALQRRDAACGQEQQHWSNKRVSMCRHELV